MECSEEPVTVTEAWPIFISWKMYCGFLGGGLVKWFTFRSTTALKCTERSIIKPDKTVNLKVHCGITNVIITACAEQPNVFLESSLDDSRAPCFHSGCPGWVMVCWPEHGIFTAPPLPENLLFHTSSICWYLNVSNLCFQRTKIHRRCWVKLRGTLLILFLVHSGSGCRAQLSPVASLLNIKHRLGAVSCLPYNFQPLTLFYDALRRLLRK